MKLLHVKGRSFSVGVANTARRIALFLQDHWATGAVWDATEWLIDFTSQINLDIDCVCGVGAGRCLQVWDILW